MMLVPPLGNVDPSTEPDIALPERVLDELAQRLHSAGLPNETRMQADRHHFRMCFALLPELIETPLQVVEEVGRRTVARYKSKLAVVIGERVRNNEMLLALHIQIVGEIGDCRKFRVRAGIVGKKEPPHASTQTTRDRRLSA